MSRWLSILTGALIVADLSYDVAIVGGGPSGLAAASRLRQSGVKRVAIIEREPEAGGIPRHCGHPPFGMREFGRILSGPSYARRLVKRALSVDAEVRCNTSVVAVYPEGRLLLSSDAGQETLQAKRILLATGVRESSRAARFIGGDRLPGVVSTGALQSLVYLKGMRPFQRPIIIGSELVSFSALLTCRHAGITPRAIIEENPRITARSFALGLPLVRGISVMTNARVEKILGDRRVTGVLIRHLDQDREEVLEADGVIVSGAFAPESTLARMAGIAIDTASGAAAVDQTGRSSDPHVFLAGNALRPVETAGWSWREGVRAGELIAQDLVQAPTESSAECVVRAFDPIRYVVPQRLRLPIGQKHLGDIQLRVSRPVNGQLFVSVNGRLIWSRRLRSLPERRITLPIAIFSALTGGETIEIGVDE